MKSLLDKVNAKLNAQGGFLKAVSVLVGGTAFAQLITIAVLPILTRLYTPDDFSTLAVYTAILSLLTSISCLRFQIAIPIPKDDRKGEILLYLSVLSAFLVTIVIFVLIYSAQSLINSITQFRLKDYLLLIVLGVFFSGIYSALQYWETRKKNYKIISKTRMSQAVGGATTQILLGLLGFGVVGLLVGQLINVASGILRLIRSFLKKNQINIKYSDVSEIIQVTKEYKNFPKYSTFEALANSATVQIPILLIAYFVMGPEVGFIMMAIRVLAAPMGLIGTAVSQVYLSEAATHHNNGNLKKYTIDTVKTLFKLGALPLFIIGVLSPFVMEIIFGEGWGRVGVLIAWMTPWFIMQFVTSPVSMVLHIKNKQKIALFLQIFGFVFRCICVFVAGLYFKNYIGEFFAISGLIFYLIYFFVVYCVLNED